MNPQPLHRRTWLFALMALAMGGVGAGCGEAAPSDVASVEKASVECPYCSLNAPDLQNAAVDGMLIRNIFRNSGDESWNLMSGRNSAVDPIAPSNISINGKPVVQLRGDRGFFQVTFLDTPFTVKTKEGANTAGLKLKFSMVNGAGQRKDYQLKLFRDIPAASSNNYAQYDIRWALDNGQSDANNTWTNICGQTSDGVQLNAFVVSGLTWDINNGKQVKDANAITIACQHDAVGACIDWGYEPWVDRTGRVYIADPSHGWFGNLETHDGASIHQTCTRATRGDFAGRGFFYTHSGTRFFVDDSLDSAARPLVPTSNAYTEAVWGPDGALCLNQDHLRTPNMFSDPEAYDAYLNLLRCKMPLTTIQGIQITANNP